jgi:hypothetical protein
MKYQRFLFAATSNFNPLLFAVEIVYRYTAAFVPVIVAASFDCTTFSPRNAEVAGSNPTRETDMCLHFALCLFCGDEGFAMGRCLAQGAIQSIFKYDY